jgi:hypothetical protein
VLGPFHGSEERNEEADLTSRAKEKRKRVEEGASRKRRKREEGLAYSQHSSIAPPPTV